MLQCTIDEEGRNFIRVIWRTKKNLSLLKGNGDKQVLVAISVSIIILLSFFVAVFTMPQPSVPIFPLWVLDENHAIPEPTMNVSLGQMHPLYIGGQNLMGKTENCTLFVKLRNMSSSLPFSGNSSTPAKPSPLPSVMNFTFALRNSETWETAFNFTIFGKENLVENSFTIDSLVIDGVSYDVILKSFSDAGHGFYYQFFFELWFQNEQQSVSYFSGVWVSSQILRISE